MSLSENYNQQRQYRLILLACLCAVLVIVVLRRAWISDDALITFRTVDNFLNGYGLRWNIIERVQTYTHPLWMFLVSITTFFTGHLLISALVLAMTCLAGLLWMLVRNAASTAAAGVAIVALTFSNAFVDYATSGLENPLTFVLLAAFAIRFITTDFNLRDLFILSLIASLALFNRLDTALFYAPALLYAFLASKRKPQAFLLMGLAQFPIILWEIFSIIYYGFPFPNTYYAKLGNGIPQAELWQQGFVYLRDSLFHDPVTLTVVVIGSITAFVGNHKSRKIALAFGALLYIAYVTRIGGDFMSGRFFAAPLVVGVLLISQLRFDLKDTTQQVAFSGLLGTVIIIGLLTPLPTFFVGETTGSQLARPSGIADERIIWSRSGNNLLLQNRLPYTGRFTDSLDVYSPRVVADGLAIGLQGIITDQDTYILDRWALGDPLLARLPAIYNPVWRVGHFTRQKPPQYDQTLTSGYNLISDPDLAEYYDVLTLITRGNLWDGARLQAIWDMNTGRYDDLIDTTAYRYPDLTQIEVGQLQAVFSGDAEQRELILSDDHTRCPDGLRVGQSGIRVMLPQPVQSELIDIRLQSSDYVASRHQIVFMRGDEIIHTLDYFVNNQHLLITVPDKVLRDGYDTLHILPRVALSFEDCINGLTVYDYAAIGQHITDTLTQMADADDLILIESAPFFERDLLETLRFDDLPSTIMLSLNTGRQTVPRAITVSNPYDSALNDQIQETLRSGNDVIYLSSNSQTPAGYPVLPFLGNQAVLAQTQTITENLPLPLTLIRYTPGQDEAVQFGDVVTLVDWDVDATMLSACESLEVESLWHKASTFRPEHVLFNVGLVLADDTGITQADGLPAERNFEDWDVTEQYRDRRTLDIPCETPAGTYRLMFVTYNYQTNLPLDVVQGDTPHGQQFVIAEITIEE